MVCQQIWGVDLTGERKIGRIRRSEPEPAVCALPRNQTTYLQRSFDDVGGFCASITAVSGDAHDPLDNGVRIPALNGEAVRYFP